MKKAFSFVIAAAILAACLFSELHHAKPDFSKAPHFDLVPSAEAQVIQPGSGNIVTAYATTTGSGAMTMLAAPNKQARNYILKAVCVNTSATATTALVKDNGTGNVLFPVACPAGLSGAVDFPTPLPQPTVNATVTMTAAAGETTLYFFMEGFTSR